MTDELTCENCFWFTKQYEIFGRCRHPRHATVGSAGSDYSSSELLKPLDVKINMVCDLHEAHVGSNLRQAYEVVAVQKFGKPGFAGYAGISIDWVRKPLSKDKIDG